MIFFVGLRIFWEEFLIAMFDDTGRVVALANDLNGVALELCLEAAGSLIIATKDFHPKDHCSFAGEARHSVGNAKVTHVTYKKMKTLLPSLTIFFW